MPSEKILYWARIVLLLFARLFVGALFFNSAMRCQTIDRSAGGACDSDDHSTPFSTTLSLPAPNGEPWITVRQLIEAGDYRPAEAMLKLMPESSESLVWTGIVLLSEGRTFASIRILEQAAQLTDTAGTEVLLGVDYFLLNQRYLAHQAVDRAFQLNPGNPSVLYLRGRLEVFSQDFAAAVQDFTSVLAKEPSDYRSLYYRGLSLSSLGRSVPAEADLLRSVEILACHHLSFSMAPYTLAKLQVEFSEYPRALVSASSALSMAEGAGRKPDHVLIAEILLLRGKVYEHLGQSTEAEADWLRSTKLDPTSSSAWYLLSTLYRGEGRTTDAAYALSEFRKIRQEL